MERVGMCEAEDLPNQLWVPTYHQATYVKKYFLWLKSLFTGVCLSCCQSSILIETPMVPIFRQEADSTECPWGMCFSPGQEVLTGWPIKGRRLVLASLIKTTEDHVTAEASSDFSTAKHHR